VQRARLLHRRSSRLSPFHFGSGVIWLPSVVAVPVVEPRLSRKVTALPLRIAVPRAARVAGPSSMAVAGGGSRCLRNPLC
jgi:hypothetical protein